MEIIQQNLKKSNIHYELYKIVNLENTGVFIEMRELP